jgi:DNA-binding NtrC family response regulator
LGLSICYGIVSEHGGTISVSNVEPSGACFTISLPYQLGVELDDTVPAEELAAPRGGRILVIDHDESVLEAVAAILRDGNHAVRTAATVAQAQQLLLDQEFDALVADTSVRAGSGEENLGDWLAANQPGLAGRLVWMSASAAPPAENHAANGVLVLQKPFKSEDLLGAIETALGHAQPAPIKG